MAEKKGKAIVQTEVGDKPAERKTVDCVEMTPEEADKKITERFGKK